MHSREFEQTNLAAYNDPIQRQTQYNEFLRQKKQAEEPQRKQIKEEYARNLCRACPLLILSSPPNLRSAKRPSPFQ